MRGMFDCPSCGAPSGGADLCEVAASEVPGKPEGTVVSCWNCHGCAYKEFGACPLERIEDPKTRAHFKQKFAKRRGVKP